MSAQVGGAVLGALLVVVAVACRTASADDEQDVPTVTPYRPTVSNPADLPAPGWLEAEFGGLRTLGEDGSRADAAPWLLKYAFDEDHGILFGGNAYAGAESPAGERHGGFGDVSLEWKQRFSAGEAHAFGIEAGVIAPTAAHALGVGKPVWLVNGIFSTDIGAAHLDLNLADAHASEHRSHSSAWQTTWASAVSWPFGTRWGGAFELSGTHQRGIATQSQALFALNYNVSHRCVLDGGVAYGLAREMHDHTVFAGATVLIGRLRGLH